MEKHKVRNLKSVMQRNGISLENLVSTTKQMEESIHCCYPEAIQLSSDNFVKMIMLDVSFILEPFLRNYLNNWTSDDSRWMFDAIAQALFLLENQLQFFALEKLFHLAVPIHLSYPSLIELTFDFFKPIKIQEILPSPNLKIEHFTDLLRTFQLPRSSRLSQRDRKRVKHLYSASRLYEVEVKFKVGLSKCLLDLKWSVRNPMLRIT